MIVALADDISGAAEIAGVASLYGLTAEVHLDGLYDSDCDVVAIDADTRALDPSAAAEKVARLTLEVMRSQPTLFYKKVDSVLRGAIAVELEAMAAVMQAEATVLVNSNPRKGRIIRGDCLLIDSVPIHETNFALDPEHPAETCDVRCLLRWENMELVTPSEFERETIPLRSVVAVQYERELIGVAWKCLRFANSDRILLAGAAEFFEALLVERNNDARRLPFAALTVKDDTLVISGTRAQSPESTRNAVGGATCVSANHSSSPLDTAREICRVLGVYRRALLTSFVLTGESAVGPNANLTADQVHQNLMEVSQFVMANCKPQHVWLEGGRTASGFLRRLGCDVLKVEDVFSDGVVGLRPMEPEAPQLLIKPGSYPWPVRETANQKPTTHNVDEVSL